MWGSVFRRRRHQAYLDNVEKKTGRTAAELIDEAQERSLSTHAEILGWLKEDYGLGVGHARAIAHVILKGPDFEVKHTTGTHRDASGTLRLTGSSA